MLLINFGFGPAIFFSCSLFDSCAVTQPGYCMTGTPTCCVIGTRGNGTTGSDCNQLGVYMLGTVCVLVCGIIIEGISIGRYQYNSTFFLWHLMVMYARECSDVIFKRRFRFTTFDICLTSCISQIYN